MSVRSDPGSVAAVGEALAPVYRTLAELYLEPPTERTVQTLTEWCVAIDDGRETLPDDLEAAFETVRDGATADLDRLKGAFTGLLQGVSYGDSPAPPYESLHVDGVLNGPSSSEVEAFYLEAGVELAIEDELIDHAGYELAFLGELCEREAIGAQLGFIETHVGAWLGEFHDEATAYDPPTFYRGVFDLTESLLAFHAETIREER